VKAYSVDKLRNVVLLAHSGTGKTSLAEAMLYDTGNVPRLGRVEDGTTTSDYDPEEQRRGISVNTAVLPCEWQDHKVNVLDTPGYMDFVGEVKGAIRVADAAIVVVCAASGVEVGTELMWSYANEQMLPRLVYINKMDRDNASFDRTLAQLGEKFDAKFVPLQIPIGSHESFRGVIDLVSMKAYVGEKGDAVEIPDELRDRAQAMHAELIENSAESDDELLMKYLDGESLTEEEIQSGVKAGVKGGALVPVLCGSATANVAVLPALQAVIDYFPSPAERAVKATNPVTEAEEELSVDQSGPLAVLVFKTLADPFVGKLTYFRVYSGAMQSDSRVFNMASRETERIGQLYLLRGKDQTPVDSVSLGDLGAVAKLTETKTGDTLCDKDSPLVLPGIVFPPPVFSACIEPKTKADLDKMGSALKRLTEEDPTLQVGRNAETGEMIMSGMGESHIDIAAKRLQDKFGVEIVARVPTVAYRETVTKVASAQGRHKKQTGGRGQFGDVFIRLEPLERGAGFEFKDEVFGGSVPRQYIPAVEKGLNECISDGVLAGFPTVDFRAVLYDGSYHSVDSSEIAFKLAARLGFRAAAAEAGPVLLEPVMDVKITVPEQFMGDILGDLNTRRARVQGMDQAKGNSIITAQAPLAELQRYATDLRAMTQGRGLYEMEFSHYEQVPAHVAEKVIEDVKRKKEEEK
jgi:elongation factor G